MRSDHREMTRALKALVVPPLKALGFAGRFPYFRRKRGAEHQMLMIGFNKYGGSFYLEGGRLSDTDYEALKERWGRAGKALAEEDLNVGHCKWNCRARLGAESVTPATDHWFVFGPEKGKESSIVQLPSHFNGVASKVVSVVEAQVERFFASAS